MKKTIFVLLASALLFGCGSSSDVSTVGTAGTVEKTSTATAAAVTTEITGLAAGANASGSTDTGNWGASSNGVSSWGANSTGTSSWGASSTGTSSWGVAINTGTAAGNDNRNGNGDGNGVTAFTRSMLSGKTVTVAGAGGSAVYTFSADGSFTATDGNSGSWTVNGNGVLQLLITNQQQFVTVSITVKSGSLPVLHVSVVDSEGFSGEGTATIH